MLDHLVKSRIGEQIELGITPENADWQYLSFQVVNLTAGASYTYSTAQTEAALVPLAGKAMVTVGHETFALQRRSVFEALPCVLYVPPGHQIDVAASADFEFAIGSAPASGKYPLRLFMPDELKVEVRGGGPATRQVNHILAYPLPAERLILFEVYVPGGQWSGWPPHCHDGFGDSGYLEETYYFRFDRPEGFAFHRNYRVDQDFDETFVCHDRDVVLVTQGFHSTAAAPGANMYFLNYLAGELIDDQRGIPPFNDARFEWILDNWDANKMSLPAVDR